MDILVIAMPTEPRLPSYAAELLGGARGLVESSGGRVVAAVLGRHVGDACRDAAAFGADRVLQVEDDSLADYESDLYLPPLEAIVRETRPAAVLFGADAFGSELAPRLAHRLGTAAVTGCEEVRLCDGELLFTRSVFGGKAVAEMVVATRPAVATVRPCCLEPLPRDEGRQVEVVQFITSIAAAPRTRVLEVRQEAASGLKLEDARVIVSGGRGTAGPEGFQCLEELARVLGGTVGASRAAVDSGWVPLGLQVGQTGKTVAPELYLAVGISGASQHVTGMSRAKHIVVINRDPEAPFFKIAEVGVAADYRQVVPALTRKLKALISS